MHLAQRAYVLIVLTAVMAIVGVWAEDPLLSLWWRAPAILFLAGIAGQDWHPSLTGSSDSGQRAVPRGSAAILRNPCGNSNPSGTNGTNSITALRMLALRNTKAAGSARPR